MSEETIQTRPRAASSFCASQIVEPTWLHGEWKVLGGSVNIMEGKGMESKWVPSSFKIWVGEGNGRTDCPMAELTYVVQDDEVSGDEEPIEGKVAGLWGMQEDSLGTFLFMNLTTPTMLEVNLAFLLTIDGEQGGGSLELLIKSEKTGTYVKSGQAIKVSKN